MLAQQHPRRYEQFMAHMNAVDALADQPWLQVDYMVDFAEWLYQTGEPLEDVEVYSLLNFTCTNQNQK